MTAVVGAAFPPLLPRAGPGEGQHPAGPAEGFPKGSLALEAQSSLSLMGNTEGIGLGQEWRSRGKVKTGERQNHKEREWCSDSQVLTLILFSKVSVPFVPLN